MTLDLASMLEERWTEYVKFYNQNAYFSAFVRLGEIANCVGTSNIPSHIVSKWTTALGQVVIKENEISSVRRDFQSKIERLRRAVASSSHLAYEEILFVLTLRVELDLLTDFLSARRFDGFAISEALDRDILAVVSVPENLAAFHVAQKSASKNWGLPINCKWLARL